MNFIVAIKKKICINILTMIYALVAELVDAADLKSVGRKAVPVRFRPSAPIKSPPLRWVFCWYDILSIEPAQCRFDYKRKRYGGIAVGFADERSAAKLSRPSAPFYKTLLWESFLFVGLAYNNSDDFISEIDICP